MRTQLGSRYQKRRTNTIMKNSEMAHNFEKAMKEVFIAHRNALALNPAYTVGGVEPYFVFGGVELMDGEAKITGYDPRHYRKEESFTAPYSDLDDIAAFVARRKARINRP
jgi:hypothetical protein